MTPEQAQALLDEIKHTERRGASFLGYWRFGAITQIWGGVWMFGYLCQFFVPAYRNWFWVAGDLAGIVASALVAGRQGEGRSDKRIFAALAFVLAFGVLTTNFIASPQAASVFWTWLFMTMYMVGGLWFGRRWTLLGALVCGASMLAFVYLSAWFDLAMAIIGGGGLILGGSWLRRAS